MLKLAEMSFAEGLDLVVAVREKRAAVPGMDAFLQQLQQLAGQGRKALEGIDPSAQRAIAGGAIGAGVGGLAGGLSSLNQPKERRTPLSRALTGALMGGGIGGLGSLALDAINSPEMSRIDPTSPAPPPDAKDNVINAVNSVQSIPGTTSLGNKPFDVRMDDTGPALVPPANQSLPDVQLPQIPEGQQPHPNNNWGDTWAEKARHLAFGQTGPNGEWSAKNLIGPGVGGAAGLAAGAGAGAMADSAVSQIPTQLPATSLQSIFNRAEGDKFLKGESPQVVEDLKRLHKGLGENRNAAATILQRGSQAGASRTSPLLQKLEQELAAARLTDPSAIPHIEQALNTARRAVDPHGLADVAKRNLITPQTARNIASRAAPRLGHGAGLRSVGGLAGLLGGAIGGRWLQNWWDPTLTQRAAEAQLQKLREAGINPAALYVPRPQAALPNMPEPALLPN